MRTLFAVIAISLSALSWAAGETLPIDLQNRSVDPFEEEEATLMVFAFMADECPISNRYAPKMNRLAKRFGAKGVPFHAVYADADLTIERIMRHRKDFGYEMPALWDEERWLVKKTGAEVTPEVAVYQRESSGEFRLIYLGRIDDQYLNYGKWRAAAMEDDLVNVLEAALAGEVLAFRKTRAVGCYIAD